MKNGKEISKYGDVLHFSQTRAKHFGKFFIIENELDREVAHNNVKFIRKRSPKGKEYV